MIKKWLEMDGEDKFFSALGAAVAVLLLGGVVLLFSYAFSTKHFKGYYLHHGGDCYKVYVNWENAPDEVAFRTYSGEEALKVYERLCAAGNACTK